MSLDIYLQKSLQTTVFSTNISSRVEPVLTAMGLFEVLQAPDKNGINTAGDLVLIMEPVIEAMDSDSIAFLEAVAPSKIDGIDKDVSVNGLLNSLRELLRACKKDPAATVFTDA